jgi:hypothetical protein
MTKNRWPYLLGVMLAGMQSVGACQSYGDFCTELMDCEGGNDADIERCEVDREEEADLASEIGCSEWYDAYFECLEAQASCTNDRYAPPQNECNEEATDLQTCAGFGGISSPEGDQGQ